MFQVDDKTCNGVILVFAAILAMSPALVFGCQQKPHEAPAVKKADPETCQGIFRF